MNGVKQGEVLSPTLFIVYTDGLLKRLDDTRVGCHRASRFTGAIAYTDDITLLAPCRSTLAIIKFEFEILCNGSKSNLLYLKERSN